MNSYLDDAGRLLRDARSHLDRLPARQSAPQELMDAAWLRMQLADRFAQLAAIERGLQPPPLPALRREDEDRP